MVSTFGYGLVDAGRKWSVDEQLQRVAMSGLGALLKRLPIRPPEGSAASENDPLARSFAAADTTAQLRQYRYRRNRFAILVMTACAAILGAFESAFDTAALSIAISVCSGIGWILVRIERRNKNGTSWVEARSSAERLRSLRHVSPFAGIDQTTVDRLVERSETS